jgi:hypothetical protein
MSKQIDQLMSLAQHWVQARTKGQGGSSQQDALRQALEAALKPGEPTPPFGSKRKAAMAIYTPPFKYLRGYIFDSQNLMVADDDKVDGAVAAQVRGWGRLGYLPNGAELQDEIGQMVADALNAYYAAPPAQKPPPRLTDEQLSQVMEQVDFTYAPTKFARAIETAVRRQFGVQE